jgi:hypothetical protein
MNPPPPTNPDSNEQVTTESLDGIVVIIEGPADTTRRPRRPNIPLTTPKPIPPAKPSPENP